MSSNMLGLLAWLLAVLGVLFCSLAPEVESMTLSILGGGSVTAGLYCAFASGRRE